MFAMRRFYLLLLLAAAAGPVCGQSLYLEAGERAVEVSGAWSTGPYSHGAGVQAAVGFGRFDLGLDVSRYTYTADDGSETSYDEYAPFVRFFALKQQAGGPPVSLSVGAQVFVADYGTDDSGYYVQAGPTVYRSVALTDRFALQPFAGFAFVAESYEFGGGPAERAQYLTRDLGLHFTTAPDRPWVLRLTLVEQSFRRETYRAVRAAVLRRL